MSGIASEPILGFSGPSGTILPPGAVIWGLLESVSPAGNGLASVTISGRISLVDESLLESLRGLVGRSVVVGHVAGRWSFGGVNV